jgi:hypothetical protein
MFNFDGEPIDAKRASIAAAVLTRHLRSADSPTEPINPRALSFR